jgi:hypothetical protein
MVLPGQIWTTYRGTAQYRVKWLSPRTADPFDAFLVMRQRGRKTLKEQVLRRFRQDRVNGYTLIKDVDPPAPPSASVAGVWTLPPSRYRQARPALLVAVVSHQIDRVREWDLHGWETQPKTAIFRIHDGTHEYHPYPLSTSYKRVSPDSEIWDSLASEARQRLRDRASGRKSKAHAARTESEVRTADRRKLLRFCRERQAEKEKTKATATAQGCGR